MPSGRNGTHLRYCTFQAGIGVRDPIVRITERHRKLQASKRCTLLFDQYTYQPMAHSNVNENMNSKLGKPVTVKDQRDMRPKA